MEKQLTVQGEAKKAVGRPRAFDKEKALELYKEILSKYPQSLESDEARLGLERLSRY